MKFQKIPDPAVNPVLGPLEASAFRCPVRRKEVQWEAKDVFNPAAVVKEGKVYLLYRAEDRVRALTHSLTHSFTHSFTRSLTHSLTHSFTHSLTH
jgi:predicted GH43/DUF377 family glycosyl hydrolase